MRHSRREQRWRSVPGWEGAATVGRHSCRCRTSPDEHREEVRRAAWAVGVYRDLAAEAAPTAPDEPVPVSISERRIQRPKSSCSNAAVVDHRPRHRRRRRRRRHLRRCRCRRHRRRRRRRRRCRHRRPRHRRRRRCRRHRRRRRRRSSSSMAYRHEVARAAPKLQHSNYIAPPGRCTAPSGSIYLEKRRR